MPEIEFKTCPNCKEKDLTLNAKVCKHCGYDFTPIGTYRRLGTRIGIFLGIAVAVTFLFDYAQNYFEYLSTLRDMDQAQIEKQALESEIGIKKSELALIKKERTLDSIAFDNAKMSSENSQMALRLRARDSLLNLHIEENKDIKKSLSTKESEARILLKKLELRELALDSVRAELDRKEEINIALAESFEKLSKQFKSDSVGYVVPSFVSNEINTLPWNPKRRWSNRSLLNIDKIIVHQEMGNATVAALNNYHVNSNHISSKGTPHFNYHFGIEKDGRIIQANELTHVTWHASGQNATSLGILVVGNFPGPTYDQGTDEPTAAQIASLNKLLDYLVRSLHLSDQDIYGHYHFGKPADPGYVLQELIEERRGA